MITLVRKFSISVEEYGNKILPVLYIQEREDKIFYCVTHPKTIEHLFIEVSKVTKILMKDN